MENEFAKKVGRDTFEKLSQETQAVILQCFDHQKWLETEQEKLEYIYSLAKLHPVYLKHQNGLAEKAEDKIQRAFQTLVLEGGATESSVVSNRNGMSSFSNGSSSNSSSSNGNSNGNGNGNNSSRELSLEDDLGFSLEGL